MKMVKKIQKEPNSATFVPCKTQFSTLGKLFSHSDFKIFKTIQKIAKTLAFGKGEKSNGNAVFADKSNCQNKPFSEIQIPKKSLQISEI